MQKVTRIARVFAYLFLPSVQAVFLQLRHRAADSSPFLSHTVTQLM